MPLARTRSVSLSGITGALVEIEADISNGLPAFILVGLPDASLTEARDRVRAAAVNSGCSLTQRKLTINLSPASLPKHGSGFDLAIAMASLAAAGDVSTASVEEVVHLGELGLDGRVRPIAGILPSVLAAARSGCRKVMVPAGNAGEASLVPDISVVPVASLREAAIWHGGDFVSEPVQPVLVEFSDDPAGDILDLNEIVGNEDAVEAMILAAAGGHHVFFLGPPGAGKTMLATRLPGILPDLGDVEALDVTSIRSLTGAPVGNSLERRPPFEAPHHTATAAAMVGGGTGSVRPGAVTRASHGVLFLDEAPEFSGSVLDVLRQPLESGIVRIHRANFVAQFPARFQLILAANPCPCGRYGSNDGECTCPPMMRRRYLGRLSGPLLDRIDIQLWLRKITSVHQSTTADRSRVSSAEARRRVCGARAAAKDRLQGTAWSLNAQVPGAWLRGRATGLGKSTTGALDRALERGGLSMRGYDRVLRLAWTAADLDGASRPNADHVGKALFLRRGMLA